jgi:hypothetical protein
MEPALTTEESGRSFKSGGCREIRGRGKGEGCTPPRFSLSTALQLPPSSSVSHRRSDERKTRKNSDNPEGKGMHGTLLPWATAKMGSICYFSTCFDALRVYLISSFQGAKMSKIEVALSLY